MKGSANRRDASHGVLEFLSGGGEMGERIRAHPWSTVYSAAAALQRVSAFAPDVVLLDIGLPDTDGYEVARRLHGLPECAAIRLVALTGYGQAEDRDRALAAGFEAHLVKPVDMSALARILAKHPARSR